MIRSMEQEFKQLESGVWLAEYEYVVKHAAVEVPDVPKEQRANHAGWQAAEQKLKVIGLKTISKRDVGNDGKCLVDFHRLPNAVKAKLTMAHVAALRLYTGPPYKPMNAALRKKQIRELATTLACCSSAVLKVSYLSKRMRVYRGVKEHDLSLKLPDEFLMAAPGKFAGGVEVTADRSIPRPLARSL